MAFMLQPSIVENVVMIFLYLLDLYTLTDFVLATVVDVSMMYHYLFLCLIVICDCDCYLFSCVYIQLYHCIDEL